MMEKTFEEAYKRLKEINDLLKTQDIVDIDQLIKLQLESKDLYELCQNKLKSIEIAPNNL